MTNYIMYYNDERCVINHYSGQIDIPYLSYEELRRLEIFT